MERFFTDLLDNSNNIQEYLSKEADRLESFLMKTPNENWGKLLYSICGRVFDDYEAEGCRLPIDKQSEDGAAVNEFINVIRNLCVDYCIEYEELSDLICYAETGQSRKYDATDTPEAEPLPKEFETDRAKAAFAKAVEAGLMSKTATGYKWNGTKALWAYFVDKASLFLDVRSSSNRIAWKPFLLLFGKDGEDAKHARAVISGYKNKYENEPEGFYTVNLIFKD